MSGVVVSCLCLVGGKCPGLSWVASAWFEANVRGRRELLMPGWRQMSGVVVGC